MSEWDKLSDEDMQKLGRDYGLEMKRRAGARLAHWMDEPWGVCGNCGHELTNRYRSFRWCPMCGVELIHDES